ncbi:hypothetical protein KF913_20305 [Candidatus Obscuribacterales bacterium]|nr:hypothetical protein [Candidatus Obscuribacterales bacterium]
MSISISINLPHQVLSQSNRDVRKGNIKISKLSEFELPPGGLRQRAPHESKIEAAMKCIVFAAFARNPEGRLIEVTLAVGIS